MKVGIFAGSFNPFTVGHYDIVSRALATFDKIYVAVANDTSLKQSESLSERLQIAKLSLSSLKNVEVISFSGFLVDLCKELGVNVIIRGLRTSADFEYEKTLFSVYKSQNDKIETVYFLSSPQYAHVSSSITRELCALKGDISKYVMPSAMASVKQLYKGGK